MRLRGGVKTPHHKDTAGLAPVAIPVPAEVTIPMSMGIGAPAKPVVNKGDHVKVGQLIGEAGGFVSSPIYASVSGDVKSIGNMVGTSGAKMQAITIASDGLQEMWEGIAPPQVTDTESFIAAVRSSGVVGLGGAGFPTSVKLTVKDLNAVDYVLINGAECEPYITSDTRTMLDEADSIREGILLLQKYMKAKRIIFGIESNKPQCVEKMRSVTQGIDGVEVVSLPSKYPQGGEKVLIYNLTGRTVPEGKLPLDVGVIVINCTTLAAIAKYIMTGVPLVRKTVTVAGSAIKEPKNVIAPIGAPMSALIDFCGGFKEEPKKILYGGPMMGIAVDSSNTPLLKSTNAVLAFGAKEAEPPVTTPCIRCGRCVSSCPMHLMPLELETAFTLKKPELLKKGKVNLCMECGSCAFACPAKRPLVQTMKLAKGALREYEAKLKAEKEREEAKKNG